MQSVGNPGVPRRFRCQGVMAARAVSLPVSTGGPGGSGGYGGAGGGLRGAGGAMRGAGGGLLGSGGGSGYSGSAYAGTSAYARDGQGGSGTDGRAPPLLSLSSFPSSTKEATTGQTVVLETRVERVEVVETNNNNNNNEMANLNIDNNNNTANHLSDVLFLPING